MKNFMKKLWKDESAQGMVEYILILVLIFAAYKIFGEKIRTAVTSASENVSGQLTNLTSGQ